MQVSQSAPRGVRATLRALARLFVPHRRTLALFVLFVLCAAALTILTASLQRAVVERFTHGTPADVRRLAAVWVALLITSVALSGGSWWLMFRIGRAVAARLSVDLFERLVQRPLEQDEGRGGGEAHSLLTRTISEIGGALTSDLSTLVPGSVMGGGSLLAIAVVDARWLIVAGPLALAVLATALWLQRRQQPLVAKMIAEEDRRFEITGQVFEGDRREFVRRAGLEPRFVVDFAATTRDFEAAMARRDVGFTWVLQVYTLTPLIAVPIVWAGSASVGVGAGAGVGEVVTLSALLSHLLITFGWIATALARLGETWPYLRRALDVLAEPPAHGPDVDASIGRADLAGQQLVLDGLSCSRGGRPVLHDVSLVAEPGAYVAFVGPNGAGKTTLLAAINGIVEPAGDGSAVRIGAVPVARIPRAVLARHIRTVGSTPVRFAGTVRANVTLLDQDAADTAVARACAIAQLDVAFLDRAADALSSGEQVQMLIAQAVLGDPAVVVLDEGLKHLYPATRARVREALCRELPDAIKLEVVHEGAVSRWVTWVVVLEDGRIVEQGAPADLLARGGSYAQYVAAAQG